MTKGPEDPKWPEGNTILQACGKPWDNIKKKSWVFTRNNYTPEHVQLLRDMDCQRMVFGYEIGAEGTPHLQGFVTFKTNKFFNKLKEKMPGFHLGVARSVEDAWNYCLKELEYEIRDNRQQGHRTDLESCTTMIKQGKRMREVADEHPQEYVKFHKGFHALQSILATPRQWYCECWICYGPAGIGKTSFARDFFEGNAYTLTNKNWWQRYEGQRKIIVNEFNEDWWDIDKFCQIVDRGPYEVEIKGGSFPLQADHIILTTNQDPKNWYINDDSRWKFERRVKYVNFWPKFKMIKEFKEKHSWWKFK